MATSVLKRILLFQSSPKKAFSLSSFSSASSSSPPSDHNSLVSTVVSLLTHRRSKSRWTHLRSVLSSSTIALTPTLFPQIALHLKSNPHLAHRFFLFTLRHSLCTHNLRSFSTIIHILSRARLKGQAQSIIRAALGSTALFDIHPDSGNNIDAPLKFFEMLVKTYRECDSAPFVFDLLIRSSLELKKIDGSIQIVRMLRSRGISPQITTCNSLICWVSRCKGSYAGYGVFREVFGLKNDGVEGEGKRVVRVRPNVQSFNALMVGFYRDGEMDMVEEVWKEMGMCGCVASVYTYSVLIAVFCDGGKMSEAEKLWEEMKAKGLKPDIMAYNTIIGGFCKIGELEKAEEFYKEMGLSGIEGSCVTSEHLINGYCRIGDVDAAILLYKDIRRKSFRPETSTMDVLIGGLCEKKRVFEALETLRVATRDLSFHPSKKSYELLIIGLCEDGKMEEALKLQAEMAGKGFEPTSDIYRSFIGGYMKLGNEEMVATLRKEMSESQKQQEED